MNPIEFNENAFIVARSCPRHTRNDRIRPFQQNLGRGKRGSPFLVRDLRLHFFFFLSLHRRRRLLYGFFFRAWNPIDHQGGWQSFTSRPAILTKYPRRFANNR